ncbi:SpoIIAA-like [Meinhardsimonia xiamenensis]|jgi:hypothetical protein|uniref:SpoIIAA-like n=1 Tax=Meinhardsimonia xiamenensis TaxID=990712 RepID=A0A1G9EGI3_9RHOB|nr:STAS/SEC14 domain-containing protein [Meinhardsimonia xiamenensis]PRX33779.1 SpoIIAA-like protein [Meinhardsimonia xiamenensis]SDK75214.1 SpoIIAA-like [Meinhardsimonia xiamenensis]
MSKADKGYFEVLEGFPADVVAVAAHGVIDSDDYENTLMPLVDERIEKEGKVHLYFECGEDFEGFTAGAAWDDAKMGLKHLGEFARVAVVTDKEWLRLAAKFFAPLIGAELRVYHLAERDKAKAWLASYHPINV